MPEEMEMQMMGRIPASATKLGATILAFAALAVPAAAQASTEVIYNNRPTPAQPNSQVSLGFEATSTSEFGGQVEFAGAARKSPTISVTMSSWACQNLAAGSACHSDPKAKYSWPITVNVYEVGAENEPGEKIATATKTFAVPYRPSASTKCPEQEGVVGFGKPCNLGKAFKVAFTLRGVTLPQRAIISVAYNTTHYGSEPTHAADIGEDSLNVALPYTGPTVGSEPLGEDEYVNSSWSAMYGSFGGVGAFGLSDALGGFQPAIAVSARLG